MTAVRQDISAQRFEELVVAAMDGLPAWVLERLDNVEVLVEAEPPRGQPNLLGLYEGVPLTRRGLGYSGVPPETRASFASGPGDKSPGYCHMSLRDEEPSQEALSSCHSTLG